MYDYLHRIKELYDLDKFAIPESGYNKYLIEKTDEFEVYCICWSSSAETLYHCHPEGGCWLLVVSGELQELTNIGGDKKLKSGDTNFQIGDTGIHKIIAHRESKSLHLYKPKSL